MKIVVPMAGRGSRFSLAGYETPKPLIEVAGEPMLAWALKSLAGMQASTLIFIILKEHDERYRLAGMLHSLYPPAEVIVLDHVTEGQLATVLTASDLLNSDEDILIASCDTYVVSPIASAIANRQPDCAGIISVANLPGNRWSFAKTDEQGRVIEVAEKVRISDNASTGLYYFSSGRQFIQVANAMIRAGEKTRGEYYVIPVYQKYVERGWLVTVSLASEMWDMGTPDALAAFETHLAHQR